MSATDKVRSLKLELREATIEAQNLAAAGKMNSEEYAIAAQRAAALRDTIGDVNTQISALATGSQFEQMSNNIGNVGSKLLNLNFAGAAADAQRLVDISKAITFSSALDGLKDLGATFLSLGKALLTNPLFLIAAVIAGLVAAIVKLLDKLGVLRYITELIGKAFEALGEFIEFVADSMSKAIDAIFGTELAVARLAEKTNAEIEKNQSKFQEIGNQRASEVDRRIKLAKAEGKATEELEREKLLILANTAKIEAASLAIRVRNAEKYGLLAKEELDKLKSELKVANDAYKNTVTDVLAFDKTKAKEQEEQAKVNAEKAKANAEKARAAAKQYAQNRLTAERQIEDIKFSLLEQDVTTEIKLNEVKYKRLIEDINKNEKLLASEKQVLIQQLSLQQAQEEQKINTKYEQERVAKEKAFQELLTSYTYLGEQTRLEQLAIERQTEIDSLKEKELTYEQHKMALEAIDNKYNQLDKEAKTIQDEEEKARLQSLKDAEIKAKLDLIESDKQIRDTKIGIAQEINNGLTSLGNAFIKDQQKLEKFNKASALIQIGIDTARAISALVAASQANPLNAVTAGLAGVAQFTSGVIQIVTNIAKAKQILSNPGSSGSFSSSSGGSSNSSAPTASPNSSTASTPSFNLFGTAGNFNNNNSQQSSEITNNVNVNSVVSVVEITKSQQNMTKILQNASL